METLARDVRDLTARRAREGACEVWLMGGGRSIEPFADADLVDRWELFTIPVLLGDGVPLFPRRDRPLRSLVLTKCRPHVNVVADLHYERKQADATS